ncbi:MAG: molybdate ABC transporter substrate-binding protein [Woeseia sp.]
MIRSASRITLKRRAFSKSVALLAALCISALQFACTGPDASGSVTVAVAANFYETAAAIAHSFEQEQGIKVSLVSGSTGKLFAQVRNGAPFDVFLSADETRAIALEDAGLAVAGSGFVYAVGRLSLWSRDPLRLHSNGEEVLRAGNFARLAIANPALAPYGAAARDVLLALGVMASLEDRIVTAENVAQVYAMVATGNAELGLLARASLVSPTHTVKGSRWDVPAALHAPIRQRAVLLQRAANNRDAQSFFRYLQSPGAIGIIKTAGYDTE